MTAGTWAMKADEKMHGPWIKDEQRYEDGCDSGASDHEADYW